MNAYAKRSPLEVIRVFCIECQSGSFQGVSECADTACPFYPYRHGLALEKGRHSPVRACRKYCFENCLPDSGPEEIRMCGGDTALLGPCLVFPFRMGKNPNKQKPLSEERRASLLENGKKYHFKPGPKGAFTSSESTETTRGEL